MRRTILALVALGLWSCLGVPGTADWPQWRGPGRDGQAPAVRLPRRWPGELRLLFQVEVGEGHASPVVWGDRVLVFTRVGDDEVVRALDSLSGRQVWQDSYRAPYSEDPAAVAHGKGPKSTPTVHEGRVYVHGMSSVLTCYDAATGKIHWRHDLLKEYMASGPQYGTAASPLVVGEVVVVPVGDQKEGHLMAFDRQNGKVRWKTPCDGPAYGSPVIGELAGGKQIVTLTRNTLLAVEPGQGRLLWQVRYRTAYEQNCLTPLLIAGDRVIVSGYMRPTVAYRITRTGASYRVAEQWQSDRLKMYMSSPILVQDHLIGLDQSGKLVCMEAKSGTVRWTGGDFGEYASLIHAGGQVLVCDEGGELVVLAADPAAYRELARLRLSEEPVWAHLAIVPGRLFVKSRTRLTAYELPQ